ncbi:MAG: hypothetical protein WC515_01790 [Candidatus Omnitrophota bacterium]
MVSIMVVTLVALVYVHQQVELLKLSYAIDGKEKRLEDMLDRTSGLEYNINDLEAPSRLEKTLLSHKVDITFPRRSQVVKVTSLTPQAQKLTLKQGGTEKRGNLLGIFEFLGLRAEAQARER